ncbi:MAG: hypothetical protein AB9834_12405 [Lentimicrobium sp.]
MEKKDYLLREIEKIGIVLQAILNRLTGKGGNTAIKLESSFEASIELLLSESGFDLPCFIALTESDSKDYLARFKGMNTGNLELLAEILVYMGTIERADKKSEFLKKAIMLYELCESLDKTYSIERESKIKEINSFL